MRSEGFSFNFGGLGRALFATRCLSDRNRGQPTATIRNRSQVSAMALALGESFGEGFAWKHDVSNSCEIARKRVET